MAALWLPASHQLGGFFGSLEDRVHVRVGLRPSADNLLLSVREVAVKVSLSHSLNEGLGHPSPISIDPISFTLGIQRKILNFGVLILFTKILT